MAYIFNTLAPIIVLVLLGFYLRRSGFAVASFFKETTKLVFYVGIPALLFGKASALHSLDERAVRLFSVLALTTLAVVAVGYLLVPLLKIPAQSMGAFVQGGYRGNQAFVGLPVVFFALDGLGIEQDIQGAVVMAIIPIMVLYNLLAVPILLVGLGRRDISMARRMRSSAKTLLSNPIILSGLGGLFFGFLDLQLAAVVQRTLSVVAGISMPLALMGVGAALVFDRIRPVALYAGCAALLKIVVSPALCYLIARLCALESVEILIVMLFAATPAAAMCYVMTDQLGGDADLAAGGIVLSTILAPLSMAAILALV